MPEKNPIYEAEQLNMILIVKVIPNSQKNALEGFQNGILKMRIKAIPDKGKANAQLIEFLAESLNIAKSQICILSGHSSRLKKIEIKEINEDSFYKIIKAVK